MNRSSFKSRGIPAFGVSMIFGGLALLLSAAILGFGTSSAFASGAQGPLAQGTQPIPQLTSTPTAAATRIPTETAGATTTTVSTGTAVATGTVVATGTARATTTAVGTAVSTGTVVGTTATAAVTSTALATSTTGTVPTAEVLPTEGTGMVETPTPISVGMPRTGTPGGGSNLTMVLLIMGVMMIAVGAASLAARRGSFRR